MQNDFQDVSLTCLCGEPFIWTPGEQAFMWNLCEQGKIKGVQEPKRCPACRLKKKQDRRDRGLAD